MRRARKRTKIEDIALDMQCTAELMPGPEDVVPDSQILAAMEEIQDLEEKDRDGRTLLSNAACYGRVKAVKYLLKRGADVNTADECGFTALHFAVQCGNEEIISLLIKAGADVNAQNQWGNSPMSMGNMATPQHIYALLLQNGADPEMKNFYGVSLSEIYPFLAEMSEQINH